MTTYLTPSDEVGVEDLITVVSPYKQAGISPEELKFIVETQKAELTEEQIRRGTGQLPFWELPLLVKEKVTGELPRPDIGIKDIIPPVPSITLPKFDPFAGIRDITGGIQAGLMGIGVFAVLGVILIIVVLVLTR